MLPYLYRTSKGWVASTPSHPHNASPAPQLASKIAEFSTPVVEKAKECVLVAQVQCRGHSSCSSPAASGTNTMHAAALLIACASQWLAFPW